MAFDRIREALIIHNFNLDGHYRKVGCIVDYEFIFDAWSHLPNHENSLENVCSKHLEFINGNSTKTIPMNLMFVNQCEAYLSAFSNLSLPKRIKYTMTLLYCSQPNHTLTYDNIHKDMFDFLLSAQLLDLTDKGIPITTKEGMYFLFRYFKSLNLKEEFV